MATPEELRACRALAKRVRLKAVHMVHRARSAHIGGSLSMADLLAALYGGILRVNPALPEWADRDRFVLSKGHACAALYATLALRGFFPEEGLESFYQDGGRLFGHVTHAGVPGVEISTGSLGHGLSVASGMAWAARSDGKSHRVFVLLSDGECDEGSVWEAALFAGHHRLDNLIAIVDYNKIQSLGHVREVLNLEPLAAKWTAFGWAVKEVDGHDMAQVVKALSTVPIETGRPSCVLAHTVKGKGVSFMENNPAWHGKAPTKEQEQQALAEIGE